MSYLSQTQLSDDADFQARVRGCCIQQANIFKDSALPNYQALAGAIMRQESEQLTFFWLTAAAPGFADTVDPEGDGEIDSSALADPDILAAVQALWPTVAGLYYDDAGAPIGGTAP